MTATTTTMPVRPSVKSVGESEVRQVAAYAEPFTVDDIPSIAKRIRRLREACGLSRPKFAHLVGGMPSTTLKNYELQYREPGVRIIQEIARVFGPQVLVWVMTGYGVVNTQELGASLAKHKLDHVVG